jgi:hypothetical protein
MPVTACTPRTQTRSPRELLTVPKAAVDCPHPAGRVGGSTWTCAHSNARSASVRKR